MSRNRFLSAAHEREPKNKYRNLIDGNDDAALFFDESKVPVEVIAVANDEAASLDPADVELLQRVDRHPASPVRQLTPRIWKDMFVADPPRSDLHDLDGRLAYAVS